MRPPALHPRSGPHQLRVIRWFLRLRCARDYPGSGARPAKLGIADTRTPGNMSDAPGPSSVWIRTGVFDNELDTNRAERKGKGLPHANFRGSRTAFGAGTQKPPDHKRTGGWVGGCRRGRSGVRSLRQPTDTVLKNGQDKNPADPLDVGGPGSRTPGRPRAVLILGLVLILRPRRPRSPRRPAAGRRCLPERFGTAAGRRSDAAWTRGSTSGPAPRSAVAGPG